MRPVLASSRPRCSGALPMRVRSCPSPAHSVDFRATSRGADHSLEHRRRGSAENFVGAVAGVKRGRDGCHPYKELRTGRKSSAACSWPISKGVLGSVREVPFQPGTVLFDMDRRRRREQGVEWQRRGNSKVARQHDATGLPSAAISRGNQECKSMVFHIFTAPNPSAGLIARKRPKPRRKPIPGWVWTNWTFRRRPSS